MPTILGANSVSDTGYDVDNSIRFEDGSSDNLSRTPSSSGNRKTWTFSTWIKRSELGRIQNFFSAGTNNQNYTRIQFNSDDTIYIAHVDSAATTTEKQTTQKFRDISSWMHVVWHIDTTQSTASNREKFYINGTQVTDFSTNTIPAEDYQSTMNEDVAHYIGTQLGSYEKCSCYFAEVVFIDGQALTPSSFGEFDDDSPRIWKPKDVSGLTFGTNGWYLDFKASANLGNDANGGTDFGETGIAAADQALDSPTNNFATWNSLYMPTDTAVTFSEGNCKVVSQNASGKYWGAASTIGITAGKWYAEFEATSADNKPVFGIVGNPNKKAKDGDWIGEEADGYGYVADGGKYNNNTENASWGSTFTAGDVISVAVDITNLKIYFAKNGTWQDSGDPTSGSTGTGAAFTILTPTSSSVHDKAYFFACSDQSTGGDTMSANFGGCPAFTISSGNADANGYGNFEYAPPSGYLALCTKNLGSDGG